MVKFKARRTDNKQWVYGYYYYNARYGTHCIRVSYDLPDGKFVDEEIEILPETVRQFTGEVDYNGIEVYNGDKLKVPHNVWMSEGFYDVHYRGAQYVVSSEFASNKDTAIKRDLVWMLNTIKASVVKD